METVVSAHLTSHVTMRESQQNFLTVLGLGRRRKRRGEEKRTVSWNVFKNGRTIEKRRRQMEKDRLPKNTV